MGKQKKTKKGKKEKNVKKGEKKSLLVREAAIYFCSVDSPRLSSTSSTMFGTVSISGYLLGDAVLIIVVIPFVVIIIVMPF